MNTEPKKGIETTDAARKAYTKRTIAAGIASVALVAALGIGAAYAHGGLNRKPNPPAGESAAVQAKEGTQEKIELTAQEVADTTADLHFAGDDVSASSNIAVSIKDGHVMVTETSEDTAANNIWYAPRRAAAMATRLKDTTIKADSEEKATDIKDVTWVTTDTSGNVQVAVVNSPDSNAAHTSGEQSPLPKDPETKQADNAETQPAPIQQQVEEQKTEETTPSEKASENTSQPQEEKTPTPEEKPKTSDVLNGSDGYTMSKETHNALPDEEKDKVSESGGKTVTDPEGNTITPAEPAPKPEEETKPQETTKQAEDTSSPSTPSNDGSSNSSSSNPGSGSNSSSTPREKRPIYRTETRYVVDQAAWSEQVYDHSEIIFSDGMIFYDNASAWQYMKKTGLSYSTKDVYKTVYHEEQGHTEEYQVLDHWE